MAAMAEELPDPTPGEARALILGTAGFWLGWAIGVGTLNPAGSVGQGGPAWASVAFLAGLVAGGWLYFGGVYHIQARRRGITVWELYRPRLPWNIRRDGAYRGSLQTVMPRYYRRAARVLGWNEQAVLVALLTLLLFDLVIFIEMIVRSV